MDIVRSKKNIITSVFFKVILLALGIMTTRYLIRYTGNEVNGIYSLFKSIVGFLTIAELGVGTAISYCMYKPIVDGDNAVVSALYRLFKKTYCIIGFLILIAGLCVMPFLPLLAKDYTVDINIYLTYALMLVSIVLSYFYSAKSSLINAYKNNYVTTIISSGGMAVQQVAQMVILIAFRSFVLFLICRIVFVALQWIATEICVRKCHGDILENKTSKISPELKSEIISNIKAMFMHKIGGALVNSVDSMIISAFCGVVLLGKYSNYVSIMTSMVGVLILFFTPLTSIIGHLYAESGGEELKKYYSFFNGVNFILGAVFFLGYYAVIDEVVFIFFGSGLELPSSVKLVITLNYFIQFLRQSTLLFRDSTGTFYYDRWKPLIEGGANLLLSLLFVYIFPTQYKLIGVLVATIITNLLICHTIEPYVLYKHVFKCSMRKREFEIYLQMVVFAVLLFVFEAVNVSLSSVWGTFVLNGCIAVLIAAVSLPITLATNKGFRFYMSSFMKKTLARLKRG